MTVWVLAPNLPARRFYEALGGKLGREGLEVVGGVQLPEVSYSWNDLESFAGSLSRPTGS